jgi:hypothetical protein
MDMCLALVIAVVISWDLLVFSGQQTHGDTFIAFTELMRLVYYYIVMYGGKKR